MAVSMFKFKIWKAEVIYLIFNNVIYNRQNESMNFTFWKMFIIHCSIKNNISNWYNPFSFEER